MTLQKKKAKSKNIFLLRQLSKTREVFRVKSTVVIVATIVLVGSVVIGCTTLQDGETDDLPCDKSTMEELLYGYQSSCNHIDLLFSEGNFQRLGELFEETEQNLVRFVEYLRANNLLHFEQNLRISFTDGEFSTSGSPREIILASMDCYEFKEILQGISNDGVIRWVRTSDRRFSDSDVEISFAINYKHTEFLRGNYGNQGANFYYIESWSNNEEILLFDFRNVKPNWYMRIMPPPG